MSTGMNHSNSVNFQRNFHLFPTNGQRSMPLFHSNKKGFGLGPTLKVTVWETQISPFCPISACTLFHQQTILTAFSLIRGNVNSTQLRKVVSRLPIIPLNHGKEVGIWLNECLLLDWLLGGWQWRGSDGGVHGRSHGNQLHVTCLRCSCHRQQ